MVYDPNLVGDFPVGALDQRLRFPGNFVRGPAPTNRGKEEGGKEECSGLADDAPEGAAKGVVWKRHRRSARSDGNRAGRETGEGDPD